MLKETSIMRRGSIFILIHITIEGSATGNPSTLESLEALNPKSG